MGDADLDSSSNNDDGPVVDDSLFYGRLQGLMMKERMTEIVLRYEVPSEFVCRLSRKIKCISYPDLMKVAMCYETLRARFCLPLHPFI